jgi:hypothetical protein
MELAQVDAESAQRVLDENNGDVRKATAAAKVLYN